MKLQTIHGIDVEHRESCQGICLQKVEFLGVTSVNKEIESLNHSDAKRSLWNQIQLMAISLDSISL